ncbi:MAG: hypothetical protein MUP55_01715 [Candidatus Aenigmarchaeota archaeon]|nr:hypothetical protein [Candidatus Aenigmarchaeota archaeon]
MSHDKIPSAFQPEIMRLWQLGAMLVTYVGISVIIVLILLWVISFFTK